MQNEELKHLLPDYITGKLDTQSRLDVENMIAHDPDFEAEYLRLQSAFNLLSREKETASTPVELNNILVSINEAIDSRQESIVQRMLKPKVFVPIAIALQAVTILVILNVYRLDNTLTQIPSSEIEEILHNADMTELALIEDSYYQDVILPDLPVEANSYSVSDDVAEDFNEIIEDKMFEDLSYEAVLSAGGSYLSDDELIAALPDQTLEEVFERVSEKPLL